MIKIGVVTENVLNEIRKKMTERHIQEAKAAPPSCLPGRKRQREKKQDGPAHQRGNYAPVRCSGKSEGIPANIARDSPGKEKRRALRKGDMCVKAIHDTLSSFAQERASRGQRGWQQSQTTQQPS